MRYLHFIGISNNVQVTQKEYIVHVSAIDVPPAYEVHNENKHNVLVLKTSQWETAKRMDKLQHENNKMKEQLYTIFNELRRMKCDKWQKWTETRLKNNVQ